VLDHCGPGQDLTSPQAGWVLKRWAGVCGEAAVSQLLVMRCPWLMHTARGSCFLAVSVSARQAFGTHGPYQGTQSGHCLLSEGPGTMQRLLALASGAALSGTWHFACNANPRGGTCLRVLCCGM
jgi:hypothetical protein